MNSVKSILMSGYYGFDNSGDDAILKAIVKDIRKSDENIEIVVLSNNPEKTREMYDVSAVNRFKLKEVFKSIRETSLLISGGGSLLQDVTSTRSLFYYLAIMTLAKMLKKPVMVYANGIGPINKKINRFLTRLILNKVDLITLREDDSRGYIQDMNIYNENIMVTADPVFTLEPVSDNRVKDILKAESIPLSEGFIGISIRKWKNDDGLIDIISRAIDYVTDKYNIKVLLIPMHYPEDLDISLKVLGNVKTEDCFVLRDRYNVEEIMGIIKILDLIVAMRLHSLIYAATQEVPMVGLSYDPKVDGILSSLEMEHICHVEDLEYEKLVENIDDAWKRREELKDNLKRRDKELKKKALLNVKMALDLLGIGD